MREASTSEQRLAVSCEMASLQCLCAVLQMLRDDLVEVSSDEPITAQRRDALIGIAEAISAKIERLSESLAPLGA